MPDAGSTQNERIVCPSCRGDGNIQWADNFPTCALCGGSGNLTRDRLERAITQEARGTYDMQRRAKVWQRCLDAA